MLTEKTFLQDIKRESFYDSFIKETSNLRKKRVLDIGVGGGRTSIYLALMGNDVTAVEPSLYPCQVLDQKAKKLDLDINIYNTSAEFMDCISLNFDVIIFHSSLHHCESPQTAVNNAYNKLNKGGVILLISEPILRFYHTKKWFYEELERNPERFNHYGGNENIYRFREYVSFLQYAGFSSIKEHPSNLYMRDPSINNSMPLILNLLKKIYFRCVKFFVANKDIIIIKYLYFLLARLSMIDCSFIAKK